MPLAPIQPNPVPGPATAGSAQPLHYLWHYSEVDRAFWAEHLEGWVPRRLLDAHTHIMDPRYRRVPMTEAMRKQYWVSEVFEPIDFAGADRCHALVFPNRQLSCVAFGIPDLDFDLEAGNDYVVQGCAERGWHSLVVLRPESTPDRIAQALARPGVIGVKPYYSLIGVNRDTRDAYLEAGIFDFLPHPILELLNDRHAWVTLHVPKAARLGHPDNLREIRELRRRYPDVVLVLAHLGRCYTEPHAREALPQLADDPGIYFDTSAVLNPACHRIALECLGPARILYGTDNPILYMRGRRQYRDRTYINRTNHPFHFNREREAPEVEATYTLYMYEDLRALRQACDTLGITDRPSIEAIFHDNAARLIESVLRRKGGCLQNGSLR
jgi:predicted TIM-barrel fold metal-dependent hydrolase